MESGLAKYMSFKEYKEKIKEQILTKQKNETLTDEKIIEDGMKIVAMYEKSQQKAGEKVGNI